MFQRQINTRRVVVAAVVAGCFASFFKADQPGRVRGGEEEQWKQRPNVSFPFGDGPANNLTCLERQGEAIAVSAPAESSSLEDVKVRLGQQKEKIESMHLRVRRVTTLSVDPRVILTWPSRPALPKYVGTDEVLVAFKGDKRYFRLLELDYTVSPLVFIDETKVWDGTVLRAREKDAVSAYQYRSILPEEARDCFPPAPCLMDVGLAVADPTASDEAHRNLQQMYSLPDLLDRWPHTVLEQTEKVDGIACIVLEGKMECTLPVGEATGTRNILDKLWLDLEHGLAVRKRETRIGGQLVRVVNADFEEALPGFWLPKRSRTETFAPPEAPKEFRDQAMVTQEAKLCLWVVNQVPDDLFDVAATPEPRRVVAFDRIPAYHVRSVHYGRRGEAPSLDEIDSIADTWCLRGVGRRQELRKGSELSWLVVDTRRWSFQWWPASNRVVASPSRLEENSWTYSSLLDRECVFRKSELVTGVFASERDQLDGKEVEKVSVYLPPEAGRPELCTHWFDPKGHLSVSGTEFRARVFRFDPETGLPLQRLCGCKRPLKAGTHDERIDHPAPERMPKELFTFQVPRGAVLDVSDPELGRELHSEAETGPDLRQ